MRYRIRPQLFFSANYSGDASRVAFPFPHFVRCVTLSRMELDPIQRAAQEQFGRQSERYARGHVLESIEDVAAALERLSLPQQARVLDVATGAGHTGLHLAS